MNAHLPKLYLIDGSGFIFRAFHALPPLKRSDGVPVGAVYGFCTMLVRLLEQLDHGKIAVVFDAGRQTFRHDIYPQYKANRLETPVDLIPQFPLIREACRAFAIPSVEQAGYEADDLLASYALTATNDGYQVIIVSSDKDLMQLVNDHVTLLDPIKNKVIDRDGVFEKFGVYPDHVIDVQALAGDSTDNVPGVPGIGIKTAAELINQFGDLDTLLAHANTIKQPKRRQSLIDNADAARISRQLVTLKQDTPLPLPIDDLTPQTLDSAARDSFLRAQGFNSLVGRLGQKSGQKMDQKIAPAEMPSCYKTVTTREELHQWINDTYKAGIVAVDTETTSLNAMQAQLVGISLAIDGVGACYIPLAHQSDQAQLPLGETLNLLQPLFLDPGILKVGHNLKYDLTVLEKYGVTITPWADTMLLSYCLDAGKNGHGLDELALRHLNHNTVKFADVAGTGKNQKTFDHVPIDQATFYAAEDADVTLRLYHLLQLRVQQEKKNTLYERIERPIIPVIVDMEVAGIKVDPVALNKCGDDFTTRAFALEEEIHQLAGRTFNVASPKQLGEILFDEMSLGASGPAPKKTKTGAYITDVDVLEKLSQQGHDLPARVLEWRSLAKLKSTYVEGLINAINPETGRVHTSFSLVGTTTGRLASSDPNLQNIPVRSEDGRKIRQAFIADKGCKLVSLDYSQIELRLLAHVAQVDPLIHAFREGHDIHKVTASQIFGIPLDAVTTEYRRRAKTINFGIIYGISAFGLAQQLGIPNFEAGAIIKAYFKQYPGIETYMERYKAIAREKGYVETLWGRRCYTPGINDNNPVSRQFAERQAINAPLQGSDADIVKMAMRKVHRFLQRDKTYAAAPKTRLILQIHDELLFEVPEGEVQTTIPLIKGIMETVAQLSVPLVVGVGVGNDWDEAH
ncbi:MAG: DNA polymerase I [Alphaproteobacteria bacterium]|nr:DNA polymerase I [Alphaproteobacteria bacterium]